MRKFTENQPFLASIEANNIDEIKRILIDNIFFLQGNKNEIDKAVEYAIEGSDFNFEQHRILEVSNKDNKEDYFSEEKWNMGENYSRDRYNLLLKLYNETFATQEYTYENGTQLQKNKMGKIVIISGVAIIAGFLIYKALN